MILYDIIWYYMILYNGVIPVPMESMDILDILDVLPWGNPPNFKLGISQSTICGMRRPEGTADPAVSAAKMKNNTLASRGWHRVASRCVDHRWSGECTRKTPMASSVTWCGLDRVNNQNISSRITVQMSSIGNVWKLDSKVQCRQHLVLPYPKRTGSQAAWGMPRSNRFWPHGVLAVHTWLHTASVSETKQKTKWNIDMALSNIATPTKDRKVRYYLVGNYCSNLFYLFGKKLCRVLTGKGSI